MLIEVVKSGFSTITALIPLKKLIKKTSLFFQSQSLEQTNSDVGPRALASPLEAFSTRRP